MVSRLHTALVRDLWHLRGQVIAVALVVTCGIAAYVAMQSVYHSLILARTNFYAAYRLADVFVHLKRAPESVSAQLRQIIIVQRGGDFRCPLFARYSKESSLGMLGPVAGWRLTEDGEIR